MIQSQVSAASDNIREINDLMSENHETLSSTMTFPLPSFLVAADSEAVLGNVLRTKPDPLAEDWIKIGEKPAADDLENQLRLTEVDQHDFWQWAPEAAQDEAKKHPWGDDYTLEEMEAGIENVNTGLRRHLEDEEDDDDDEEDGANDGNDDDDEAMDVDNKVATTTSAPDATPAVPLMPIESIHRFMTTGKVG